MIKLYKFVKGFIVNMFYHNFYLFLLFILFIWFF